MKLPPLMACHNVQRRIVATFLWIDISAVDAPDGVRITPPPGKRPSGARPLITGIPLAMLPSRWYLLDKIL